MMKYAVLCVVSIYLILFGSISVSGSVLHVPGDYSTLQAGINAAWTGDTVLAADGTYYGSGNKNLDFQGKNIRLMSENGPEYCVIDCENSGRGFYFHSGESQSALVKGFTIQRAMSGSQHGAGIYIENSSPTIQRCILKWNKTGDYRNGGGIYCTSSTSKIYHCSIIRNTASYASGGGVYCTGSVISLYNCTIAENSCRNEGAGLYAADMSPDIKNCTFVRNTTRTSEDGGGIYCVDCSPTVMDSIIWGNVPDQIYLDGTATISVTYSDVEGGYAGTGNINVDPLFVRGMLSSYYISQTAAGQSSDSPCLDAGSGTAASICFTTVNGTVCLSDLTTGTDHAADSGQADMGSHLFPPASPPTPTPLPTLIPGSTINVPADYTTIQDALNAAFDGDTIFVSDGTYYGSGNKNLDFTGKSVRLQSLNGPEVTVIDCEDSGRGFYFHSGEDRNAIVEGFKIQRGLAVNQNGCGIYIDGSSPSFRNCIIDSNRTSDYRDGAGIYCNLSEASFANCTVTRNTSYRGKGGGIYCSYSSPEIINCTITRNSADNGAGTYFVSYSPVLVNCDITENNARLQGGGIYSEASEFSMTGTAVMDNYSENNGGGGVYITYSECEAVNCIFSGNYAGGNDPGGGIYCLLSSPALRNVTIVDGTASQGGAVYCDDSSPAITGSILWNNSPNEIQTYGYCYPVVTYSDVEGGYAGTGNINADPLFVDGFYGDDYLSHAAAGQAADSPCIDAGSALASELCFASEEGGTVCLDDLTTRTDSVTDSGQADMGYHFKAEAQATPTPTPTVTPTDLPASPTPATVIHVPADYTNIQAAIDAAYSGDQVLVADGTYFGAGNKNLDFSGKNILLASVNGPEYCIIDCEDSGRGFHFHSGETSSAVVRGFTVQRGYLANQDGGGLYCVNSSPTFKECIFDSSRVSDYRHGGGIYCEYADASFINCTITRNTANYGQGGGVYTAYSSPLFIECTISVNYADYGGGINFYGHSPTIHASTVINNTSRREGAGIYCDATDLAMTDCKITENLCQDRGGGGIYCYFTPIEIVNCLFTDNYTASSDDGAGIYCDYSDSIIRNTTFIENTASGQGGALYSDNAAPIVTNCIFWNDYPNEIHVTGDYAPEISYCDVQGGYSGTGNIDSAPLFCSGFFGDYYLSQTAAGQSQDSPCLNAGSADASSVCYDSQSGFVCLDQLTTRSDNGADAGTVDMGFHYSLPGSPTATPTPTFTPTQTSPTSTPVNVIHVPDDYATIQAAIDAAYNWDMIIVSEGTYTGTGNKNLDFNGKDIFLTSESGPEKCVIDCENSGRGFYFHMGESANAVVNGFCIQRGYNANQDGGGIHCDNSSPTIMNCVLRGNSVNDYRNGGGIYCYESDAVVKNCTVTRNTATYGKGAGIYTEYSSPRIIDCILNLNYCDYGAGMYFYSYSPVVENCTVTGNTSRQEGAGVYSDASSLLIVDSDISGNYCQDRGGGGLYSFFTPAEVINCIFTDNYVSGNDEGAGIYCDYSDAVIVNCTFTINTAARTGGAIYCDLSSPLILNSVLWGNYPDELTTDAALEPIVMYSDIQGGYSGSGNINENPSFASGTYGPHYLSQTAAGQTVDSACVDAGAELAGDICYFNGSDQLVCLDESTTRTDSVPDSGIADMGFHYATDDPTETPTPEPTYTEAPPTSTPSRVIHVPADYDTIQAAIDAAYFGDMVLVADGTYVGAGNKNLDFTGKEIILASENGYEHCIIDCEDSGRGIHFHNGETNNAVVKGFTIQRGYLNNGSGAGICCEYSSPAILDCRIKGNRVSDYRYGAGIYCSNSEALIKNCLISDNSAQYGFGGGIYTGYSSVSIVDCTIRNNYCDYGGGLNFYNHSPTVSGCTITENTTRYNGAGIYSFVASLNLTNSVISSNISQDRGGAGMFCYFNPINITNCIFHDNYAGGNDEGAAIFCSHADPVIMNCTFYDNGASRVGGALYCERSSPWIINCIMWGNTPNEISDDNSLEPNVIYSDVENGYSGPGNIDSNPLFYDGIYGDFYLSQNAAGQPGDSPCVDAGNDQADAVCFKTTVGRRDCLSELTTRSDAVFDSGIADMGFHYFSGDPTFTPSPTPTATLPPPTSTPLSVIYVPDDYATIQDAIDAAYPGGMVLVADGTYTGTGNKDLDFNGKNIILASENGAEHCVIDCEDSGRGFNFHSGENKTSVVRGFRVQRGNVNAEGGGIYCSGSSPTFIHCTVTGNSVSDYQKGAGIYCTESSSLFENCTISRNEVTNGKGGGLCSEYASPVIRNCTILQNTAENGAGLYFYSESPQVIDSVITRNRSEDEGAGIYCNVASLSLVNTTLSFNTSNDRGGGGIYCYFTEPDIINCLFHDNYAGGSDEGAAVYCSYVDADIVNCTFTQNTASRSGGALHCEQSSPVVTNCIMWGNVPDEISDDGAREARVSFSDIQSGYSGYGNIEANPLFYPGFYGEYYLSQTAAGQSSDSPCADTGGAYAESICYSLGDGTSRCLGDQTTRSDHETDADTVDMGYHYLAVSPSPTPSPTPAPTIVPLSPTPITVLHVPSQYATIQAAIDAASDGDMVLVADGTWQGPGNRDLDFLGKRIIVKSENGPDDCIIDCELSARGFYFHNGEDLDSVVNGFSIINGYKAGEDGGGIYCTSSSPTIKDCLIKNNTAGQYRKGGGVYCFDSHINITHCTVTENSAHSNGYGGGIYSEYSSPLISSTAISRNTSEYPGGGAYLYLGSPSITHCTIAENSAYDHGAGLYSEYVKLNLMDCFVMDNAVTRTSRDGAGLFVEFTPVKILNCVFSGNHATRYGGGIYLMSCDCPILNCTFTSNTADSNGGAVYLNDSSPSIVNCIMWNDVSNEIYAYDSCYPLITYCNIQNGYTGEGNISANPLFYPGPLGNFYLCQIAAGQGADSPCVNAGADSAENVCFYEGPDMLCMDDSYTRTDHVPDSGLVDMGYHYNIPQSPIPTLTPTITPTQGSPSPSPTQPTFSPTPTEPTPPTTTPTGIHSPEPTSTLTPITTGTPIPQTNCGESNDFTDYGCGITGLEGDDVSAMFILQQVCDFTISISNVTPAQYDPILLISTSPDPADCIDYADDNGPGLGETIAMTQMPPGYYYAVIDSVEECGYYDLTLNVGNCADPTPAAIPASRTSLSLALVLLLSLLITGAGFRFKE